MNPSCKERMCRGGMLVLLATTLATPAWAISDENDFVNDFGMVGLVLGQAARLSVLNAIGDPDSRPCAVELRFFDSRGVQIGRALSQELRAREAAFLDLAVNDPVLRAPQRLQVHAQVTGKADNPRARRACSNNLVPTLEVFDLASGQTRFLHPGVIRGFNPQPDPPGSPTGGR